MSENNPRVLVVDDDAHILNLMQSILEFEGYMVFRASDGKAALDIFGQKTPDLVLLDAMMFVPSKYPSIQSWMLL